MKKLLIVLSFTFCMTICLNSFLVFNEEILMAEASEVQEKFEEPCIYYDTSFEEVSPKQLLEYNNDMYLATRNKLYRYDLETSRWITIDVGRPVDSSMGTLKVLNCMALKESLVARDCTKIVSDINNDGKEVYELNLNSDGKYYWTKIIENGKICKELEADVDEYKMINLNKNIDSSKVKIDGDEYYFSQNTLYVNSKDSENLPIKTYEEEEPSNLKLISFGKEVYIYGGTFGIEKVSKSKNFEQTPYSIYSVGKINSSKGIYITNIAAVDNGKILFVIGSDYKVYKIIMPNTWVFNPTNIPIVQEEAYVVNEESKIKELTLNDKRFKIITNTEWGKSYITVNDKILEETIRGSYQYPDHITRFSDGDNFIYVWSDVTQPIRINIKDNSVEFMGQWDLFTKTFNYNEKLAKDQAGNLYIIKSDKKSYRYVERDRFYDTRVPSKATDIKILNNKCYAISETGLYMFSSNGQWQQVVEGDINEKFNEELIVLGNTLYALSDGSLYTLNSDNKWEIVEGKVNNGLTPVYYVNDNEKKVYFVAEEKEKKYVNILDYSKNQWSKTKELPEINHIQSIAVEGVNIYVGTQYIAHGVAYVYRNCAWTSILPQLNIVNYGTSSNSKLLVQEGEIYIKTVEKGKNINSFWRLKDGNASKVEDIKKQENISAKLKGEGSYSINSGSVIFILKDGKVLRKVM